MNLLQLIADVFINTMGITKPSAASEKRAARYIVLLLAAVLAAVAALTAVTLHLVSRR